jgi:hypothetical protein
MTKKEGNKSSKSEQIWLTIFLTLPVALTYPTSEFFDVSGITKILIGGILGGIGGLIGFILFFFFKSKSAITKGAILTLTFAIGITGIYFVKRYNSTLTTCEVCGYIAIERNAIECQYCGSYTWEKEKQIGDYLNKTDWLVDEQLFLFSLPVDEELRFFTPETIEGFIKDENWTPVISESQLNENITMD